MNCVTGFFLAALLFVFLEAVLIVIVKLWLTNPTSSQPEDDSLARIHAIGLEARQEMDRVCNDFESQRVQHLFNEYIRTYYTDTEKE